ncbi:MAG: ISLre2 family transposase [Rivularia sp. (in: cyanobacteria)]|uniref:ISLre2 family transposase n=1 Tax=Rivularia sp. UHCC 0363 TaxID=3110244 RepID=UPI002B1F4115|nr:ISLre2 family transposase [Rivularia sp. UHCC 0363]MEA5593394.1 ISLre2 family transposase [Rivularia sp. UHCC 0363]
MNKIYATLDLNKSVKEFKDNVTKILELTDVENWDGVNIKEKEEKIRNIALILAGQCIAILLYNLSHNTTAINTSNKKTQAWWRAKTKNHGYKTRQILTIGNVELNLTLPYVVERNNKNSKTSRAVNQGFCPFLRWLGMEEGITPLVWSNIAKYGAISSSFEAAHQTLIDWGINISLKRIERLTYCFGKIGLSLRESKIFNLKIGNLIPGNILKDQRVVIAADGGRTRIRIDKKGRKNSKTNRHGFTGEWIEPKVLTIYTVDKKGKKIKNGEIPIINDGTYEDYQGFLKILEMYLVSLGINQAQQVLLIADGAEWIWKHIPPLLKKLNCPLETYQLLDFYHATEHLQVFADNSFSQEAERKKWFKQTRSALKKGKINSIIQDMNKLSLEFSGERRKNLDREINYFIKGNKEGRFNYHKISSLKLPIGSGAVESLIRQAVNLRMKGNSKFWLKNNAEIMLHARCQWIAGCWNKFCDSILTALLKPIQIG